MTSPGTNLFRLTNARSSSESFTHFSNHCRIENLRSQSYIQIHILSSRFYGLNRLYFGFDKLTINNLMLDYSEITERKYIVFEDEPYEVIDSHVFRKQQRKPVNATKLRSLLNGRIVEHSFHVSDKVREALIDKKEVKYLYTNREEYWFAEASDPSKRFKLPEEIIGPAAKFLKPNILVDAMLFNSNIIGLKLPIKMDLKVTEAHPATKGNTTQGATKTVKLETGVEIQAPMFIKEGDTVRVNTMTGEYADRI